MKKLALVRFSGILTALVCATLAALFVSAYGDALNDALYTVLRHRLAAFILGLCLLFLTIIFTEDI